MLIDIGRVESISALVITLLLMFKLSFGVFRFTNNVLSTAQQVWLRKLGGAQPAINENASGIISAGRAKRSIAQPDDAGER